jgi:hypothetical protein
MSSRSTTRRIVARRLFAAALLVSAVAMIGARPFAPGVSFKMRMTLGMPSMPGMNGGDVVIVGHGVAAGGRSRLDIDSAPASGPAAGPFGPGDYFLSLDSGRVVAVSPASKTYIDGFSMAMGSMPAEMMAQAQVSNVVVNAEKMGAGETIEGIATDKYKLSVQYTMQIMGQSINISNESQLSTAQLPSTISTPFTGALPKTMATGPFAELYSKMADAQKKIGGTALRVSTTTSINGPMSMNMSQTMQMTDVKPVDVDEKVFSIPDGFTPKPPSI